MHQLPSFTASSDSCLIGKLHRSLYGLKQWFGRFSHALLQFGKTRWDVDHFVFSFHSSLGKCLVGRLKYLTITLMVSVVCQFLNGPCDSHWDVVTCILHYLA